MQQMNWTNFNYCFWKWKLQTTFEEFKTYQQDVYDVDLSEEFTILEKIVWGCKSDWRL
jgi:hypothetical protein